MSEEVRTFEEAVQRQAAQVIERMVSGMRTDEALRPWWAPWRRGYSKALAEVHEEVQAVLDEFDIWHPKAQP